MKSTIACLVPVALALLAYAGPASASITIDGGADWPGSADTTGYTGSGDALNGGDTWTYPAVGSSGVKALYFGLWNTTGQGVSGDGSNNVTGSQQFTWYADTSNSIEYRATFDVPGVTGDPTYTARLVLTDESPGDSVVSDSTTQGLDGDVHSLFDIVGSSFTVDRVVQIWDGSGWESADSFYNAIPYKYISDDLYTNFSTGFYWENASTGPTASTPEPTALALMGIGLLGLTLGRKRRV